MELVNTSTMASGEIAPVPVLYEAVEGLSERLCVEVAEVLDLVGIPERTRARRRQEGLFKADEADRIQRVARVFGEAIRVFGSEGKAALWLRTPAPAFGSSAPLSFLGSDAGAHAVSQELVRIDFGDFA